MNSNCVICQKLIAVSLYIRVKPLWETAAGKWQAPKKQQHLFFGYWPKESHLAEYLRMEYERQMRGAPDPILQRLWEGNCHGHPIDQIIEGIEQLMPPMPGIALKILWNPSPRVTPFLLAETNRERTEAQLSVNNDLRWCLVMDKSQIRDRVLSLVNNSTERVIQSISRPLVAVKGY